MVTCLAPLWPDAEMVGGVLTEAGVPNAVIDLDWLRRSWPSPSGDRFNG